MAALPLSLKRLAPRLVAGTLTGVLSWMLLLNVLMPYRTGLAAVLGLLLCFILIGCSLWLGKAVQAGYLLILFTLVMLLLSGLGRGWYALLCWGGLLLMGGVLWGKEVQAWQQRSRDTPWEVASTLLHLLVLPGLCLAAWRERRLDRINEQMRQAALQPQGEASTRLPTYPPAQRALPAPIAGSGLYLLTLAVEGVCALVRSFLLYLPLLAALAPLHILVFWATHENYATRQLGVWGYANDRWLVDNVKAALTYTLLLTLGVGFWPVLRSLWHSLVPYGRSGDGPQEYESLGARAPTRPEHATIIETLRQIQAQAGGAVAAPSAWLVLDEPVADAFSLGSTVYLSRAAVESEHLAGIIAHELGHIAYKDGDLLLSLRRLITPLAYFIGIDRSPLPAGAVVATGAYQQIVRSQDEQIFYRFQALKIKALLAFWFGGLGLLWLGQSWAAFWRQRDYWADDYAVRLGQDEALKAVLRMHRSLDVVQPFLLTNRPYTAQRLDRLEG